MIFFFCKTLINHICDDKESKNFAVVNTATKLGKLNLRFSKEKSLEKSDVENYEDMAFPLKTLEEMTKFSGLLANSHFKLSKVFHFSFIMSDSFFL